MMITNSDQMIKKEPKLNSVEKKTASIHANHISKEHAFLTHQINSGLNPLVDAAAYLFSIIGKLKQLKSYRHLSNLQKELIQEIDNFQINTRSQRYSAESILVCRYALCATLDDIIANTLWGGQGQWDSYSLLAIFNQDAINHERFFVILERIVKDPALYIDVMELMYLCLSLGYKGNYRTTEFGNSQLEQITNSLYKHIRAHRGNFNKTLAPFPLKALPAIKPKKKGMSFTFIFFLTLVIILVIFMGLGYMLDTISNQAYRELMQIGNSILYETVHP